MKFIQSNKMQISIFILIVVMIIFLFFFLISNDSNGKIDKINSNKNILSTDSNSKVSSLKDNVDFCLESELRKAVIIAGARGGFIYREEEEYYFPGSIPNGVYNSEFLNNIGVSQEYLKERTVVYNQIGDKDYLPEIYNNTGSNFNHTIKNDMERFILNGVLDCLDIEGLEKRDYKIEYEHFSGPIKYVISTNNIVVDGIIGNVGDNVTFDASDKIYYGKITDVNSKDKITHVNFGSLTLLSQNDIIGQRVLNKNSSVNVEVIFHEEQISAKLDFPITISKGTFVSSYKNSEVILNVRFNRLLSLAKELRDYKYFHNHTLNITDDEVLENYFNGQISRDGIYKKSSKYFQNTPNRNFKIVKMILPQSTDEHVMEVYTIIDGNSKILGEPYIFNFGYENYAPVMNLSRLFNDSKDSSLVKNSIVMVVPKNKFMNFDLRSITLDPQYADNFYEMGDNRFYFTEKLGFSYNSAEFNLNDMGVVRFVARQQGIFNYEIEVTDGETKSVYDFKFIAGFPDNSNNAEAMNCFRFQPYVTNEFPIDYRTNGLRSYISGGKTKLYAYQNYINPLTGISGNSRIFFSQGCIFDPSRYNAKYKINNIDKGILESPFVIDISSGITVAQKVEVSIVDSSNNPMTEPYEITIYPAGCLGPATDDFVIKSAKDAGLFGSGMGTCCDISGVLNSITSGTPRAFTGTNNNLKSSGIAANSDMYFTFAFNSSLGDLYDYDNKVIWDDFGNDATALYMGTFNSVCQGLYPRAESNVQSVTSSNSYLSGKITAYSLGGNIIDTFPNGEPSISLSKIRPGGKCNFNVLASAADFNILFQNQNGKIMPMVSGFIFVNPISDIYTGTIPSSGEGSEITILCDNKWYISEFGNDVSSNRFIEFTLAMCSKRSCGSCRTTQKSEGKMQK